MQDSLLNILFLGDNLSWTKLSDLLAESPSASLNVHRIDSLAGIFHALAVGNWHALVLDVHSWNFQGLHYVEKVRSEYPAFPILALHTSSIPDLDAKAVTSGASRCLSLNKLTVDELHEAVATTLADIKSRSLLGPSQRPQFHFTMNITSDSRPPASKNQAITHALNNLLCVISANAELLADHLPVSCPDAHPLTEIKKAAQSAAVLMRQLK